MSSDSYPPWERHPTPRSPFDLEYSPSIILSSEHLSVYVDENNLHHPSMKVWTPASSTDLNDTNLYTGMVGTSSQVLERIRPIESGSFGSAEEMFKMRDEQASTREYSLRQTYSFLNEMSSSAAQNFPLAWTLPGKERVRAKPSRKITPPLDDTWSPPTKETGATYTKYSRSMRPPTDDARQASLNKNKLAAAKCRVNKNIQTDKLRESAHTAVATNNRLWQEVMDKMEEIQALHTEVLCHAVDSGCRDPHELREFLCSDEGQDTVRGGPATSEEPHACNTFNTETCATLDAQHHHSPGTKLSRRRSDAPSPTCGINRFKHGSMAHQRTERNLHTRFSEP